MPDVGADGDFDVRRRCCCCSTPDDLVAEQASRILDFDLDAAQVRAG